MHTYAEKISKPAKIAPRSHSALSSPGTLVDILSGLQRTYGNRNVAKLLHQHLTLGTCSCGDKLACSRCGAMKDFSSGGRHMERGVRDEVERSFGEDFGDVRIHTDTAAAKAAEQEQAIAYTQGNDIVFASSRYVPGTEAGRELLAHELAHVVQQRHRVGASATYLHAEAEARHAAKRASVGSRVSITSSWNGGIQRQSKSDSHSPAQDGPATSYQVTVLTPFEFFAMTGVDVARLPAKTLVSLPAQAQASTETTGHPKFIEKILRENQRVLPPEQLDLLKSDVKRYRANAAIPRIDLPGSEGVAVEGGVVAVVRSDIPGIDGRPIGGASPSAIPKHLKGSPGTTGGEMLKPANPIEKDHAEHVLLETLRSRLEALLASKQLSREQLKGRTVWMLVEQEPCPSCASGLGTKKTAGVIAQFSALFPELTILIQNLRTSRTYTVRGGNVVPLFETVGESGVEAPDKSRTGERVPEKASKLAQNEPSASALERGPPRYTPAGLKAARFLRYGGGVLMVWSAAETYERLEHAKKEGPSQYNQVAKEEAGSWVGGFVGGALGEALGIAIFCAATGPATFACVAGVFVVSAAVGMAGAATGRGLASANAADLDQCPGTLGCHTPAGHGHQKKPIESLPPQSAEARQRMLDFVKTPSKPRAELELPSAVSKPPGCPNGRCHDTNEPQHQWLETQTVDKEALEMWIRDQQKK